MKTIAIYELCSGLHREAMGPAWEEPFVREVVGELEGAGAIATAHGAPVAGDEAGAGARGAAAVGAAGDGVGARVEGPACAGAAVEFCGGDFSSYGSHDCDVIFVRTGGTEGLFRALNLPQGHVLLLTSGQSNSLAASMEILAYLRSCGSSGEILHGVPGALAQRLLTLARGADAGVGAAAAGDHSSRSTAGSPAAAAPQGPSGATAAPLAGFIRKMPDVDLGGIRLGIIGRPSDWLIASGVDYAHARRKFNVELVDIPMAALTDRIFAAANAPAPAAAAPAATAPAAGNAPAAAATAPAIDLRSFAGSELIYDVLKSLAAEYRLSGLTLRCFDLLDSVHNTGCLALARLNAEGLPCSCEGDIPALLSMVYLNHLRGCPGFQCNLSRIDGDELLFAHCTVPLNMCTSYGYATHFESGIGTAIKGELPCGPAEIFKISPSLEECVRIPVRIVRNCALPNLCRTQIVVVANTDDPAAAPANTAAALASVVPALALTPAAVAEYFLTRPLANHHIISLL